MERKILIFDYDGTIHETLDIYYPALCAAYEELVRNSLAPERALTPKDASVWLGVNSVDMWNRFMPDLPAEWKKRASALVGEEMIRRIREGKAHWYEGAEETLRELKKNYSMVILSNCKEAYMNAHRKAFPLDELFDGFYCCETYGFAPKTEIFPVISREHPGLYCVIGDRRSDLETALRYQLPSVACRYGYGQPEEWESAGCSIGQIRELKTVFSGQKNLL